MDKTIDAMVSVVNDYVKNLYFWKGNFAILSACKEKIVRNQLGSWFYITYMKKDSNTFEWLIISFFFKM